MGVKGLRTNSFFLNSSLAEMYNAVGQTVKKEEVELVAESSLDDSLINLTGMNISVDFILYKLYILHMDVRI